MLDNMTNWSKMKKRILIGSLRGPNFAIRTAKMERSRILVLGNFVFKTLHKESSLFKRKTPKWIKEPKAKEQPAAKQVKPVNVVISTITNQRIDSSGRQLSERSFFFCTKRNGLFLSSLGPFFSFSFSSKTFFPFSNFLFESERLPRLVTCAMQAVPNNMKYELQDGRLLRKFPRLVVHLRDYDTLLFY